MEQLWRRRVFGIIFILIGIGYLGEQMQLWDFTIFIPGWWTIFLILPALFSMMDNGPHLSNVFVLLLGGYFYLSANDWIDNRITFGAVVALCVIFIGLKLIFGERKTHKNRFTYEDASNQGENLRSHIYFGSKKMVMKGHVNSVHLESIFGAQTIDLSEADLHDVQFVSVDSIFATVDLLVRDDVHVKMKRDVIFGNCYVEDERGGIYDVLIDASCIFGQIRIRKQHIEDDILDGKYKEK